MNSIILKTRERFQIGSRECTGNMMKLCKPKYGVHVHVNDLTNFIVKNQQQYAVYKRTNKLLQMFTTYP